MTRGDTRWTLTLMAAVCASSTLAHAPARADEGEPAALSWVRGEHAQDCISTRELAAQVEAYLGRAVFVAPAQASLAVEASIERDAEPDRYLVRFGLIEKGDTVDAVRALDLPPVPCRELDPLLVFVLSAMLDPDAPLFPPRFPDGLSENTKAMLADLFGSEPTVPPLELAAPSGIQAKPQAEAAPKAPGPVAEKKLGRKRKVEPQRSTLIAFTSAGASVGLQPSMAPIVSMELRGRMSNAWTLRGSASFWFESTAEPVSGVEAGISAWTLTGLACLEPLWDGNALPLRPCGGAMLGIVTTHVSGLAGASDPTRFYAAPVLALDAAWPLGSRAWVRAGLGGFLSLVRDRFFVHDADGVAKAHQAALFGAQLDLGVGFAFY